MSRVLSNRQTQRHIFITDVGSLNVWWFSQTGDQLIIKSFSEKSCDFKINVSLSVNFFLVPTASVNGAVGGGLRLCCCCCCCCLVFVTIVLCVWMVETSKWSSLQESDSTFRTVGSFYFQNSSKLDEKQQLKSRKLNRCSWRRRPPALRRNKILEVSFAFPFWNCWRPVPDERRIVSLFWGFESVTSRSVRFRLRPRFYKSFLTFGLPVLMMKNLLVWTHS